jgi:hypothetical protein
VCVVLIQTVGEKDFLLPYIYLSCLGN